MVGWGGYKWNPGFSFYCPTDYIFIGPTLDTAHCIHRRVGRLWAFLRPNKMKKMSKTLLKNSFVFGTESGKTFKISFFSPISWSLKEILRLV